MKQKRGERLGAVGQFGLYQMDGIRQYLHCLWLAHQFPFKAVPDLVFFQFDLFVKYLFLQPAECFELLPDLWCVYFTSRIFGGQLAQTVSLYCRAMLCFSGSYADMVNNWLMAGYSDVALVFHLQLPPVFQNNFNGFFQRRFGHADNLKQVAKTPVAFL